MLLLLLSSGIIFAFSLTTSQATHISISGHKLGIRYIPLPLPTSLVHDVHCGSNYIPEFLRHLNNTIDLTSVCGYITVLAPSPLNDSKSSAEGDALMALDEVLDHLAPSLSLSDAILPQTEQDNNSQCSVLTESNLVELSLQGLPLLFVTLHLGLPIFNASLLRAVCNQIASRQPNLLTPKARIQLEAANKKLLYALDDFVYNKCRASWPRTLHCARSPRLGAVNPKGSSLGFGEASDQIPGPWPLPTRSIVCGLGDWDFLRWDVSV